MERFKGIAASKGIAIGKLYIHTATRLEVKKYKVTDVDNEIKRFKQAIVVAIEKLGQLHSYALATVGANDAFLFNAHIMILKDSSLVVSIENIIRKEHINAEYATKKASKRLADSFNLIKDEYLRERVADIKDVSNRVISILCNQVYSGVSSLNAPIIIGADDFMPSETVQMDREKVLAIVTRNGSKISHSAILARTMGIPAVVGIKEKFTQLKDGATVIVDGLDGYVIIDPTQSVIKKYQDGKEYYLQMLETLKELKGKPAVTLDGKSIKISANIGHSTDIKSCIDNDANGIGLLRTEFLYMEADEFPDEEYQFTLYKSMLERVHDRVIIRTLDIGADKQLPYYKMPHEENPALGLRGIRVSMKEKEMFDIQLRALHRASVFGKLAILFPMIISVDEVRAIRARVESIRKELSNDGIPFDIGIEYGIMIETPASVMVSSELAKMVDFFSIGTNDLTQYVMACDRLSNTVPDLFDSRSDAVLRMIEMTVSNAHKNNIWVSICGDSAADLELTWFYLNCGVDELSVPPVDVLPVRNKVMHINING